MTRSNQVIKANVICVRLPFTLHMKKQNAAVHRASRRRSPRRRVSWLARCRSAPLGATPCSFTSLAHQRCLGFAISHHGVVRRLAASEGSDHGCGCQRRFPPATPPHGGRLVMPCPDHRRSQEGGHLTQPCGGGQQQQAEDTKLHIGSVKLSCKLIWTEIMTRYWMWSPNIRANFSLIIMSIWEYNDCILSICLIPIQYGKTDWDSYISVTCIHKDHIQLYN